MTADAPSFGHENCHHRIYLISCDQYEVLLARAGGACERCGCPATGKKLFIDHEHDLGSMAVRGLVCRSCNRILCLVDYGKREMDPLTSAFFAKAYFLTLPNFKTYMGPGTKPHTTINSARCKTAMLRYLPGEAAA